MNPRHFPLRSHSRTTMVNKNIFLMQGEKEVGIARFRSSVKTEAPRGIKLPMPKKPRETYYVRARRKWHFPDSSSRELGRSTHNRVSRLLCEIMTYFTVLILSHLYHGSLAIAGHSSIQVITTRAIQDIFA
jgi:hypothetical protein